MITNPLRRTAATVAAGALFLGLAACSGGQGPAPSGDTNASGATETTAAGEITTVRVGALPVPAGQILEFIDENLAEEAGIDIEIVEFSDYNTPNPALTDGSTDANLFQNQGFLNTYNEQAGGDLVSIGEIYLPAAQFHSEQYKSFDEIPEGSTIVIPNDPTNEGRALGLLAANGVIGIEEGATNLDGITANPKNFKFEEVENATLPLAVKGNAAAFVTASFAIPAGLKGETAILSEGDDSKYYNVLATRSDNQNDPAIQTLHELLLSPETQQFINDNWEGLIIPRD